MKKSFARKDKLNFNMKKCMAGMVNVNVILDTGCTYKIDHIATVVRPRPLSLVSLLRLDIPFYPVVSNANYLICIFMNFNETIKEVLKSINEQFSRPNHHYDTVIALVIYHVTNILMSWTYLKILSYFNIHEY